MKKYSILLILISWPVVSMEYILKTVLLPLAPLEQAQAPIQRASRQSNEQPRDVNKSSTQEKIVIPPSNSATTINIVNNLTMNQNASGNNCIDNNNDNNNHADARSESVATAQAKAQAQVEVDISQSPWNYDQSLEQFLSEHKIFIGLSVCAALYTYYCYQVIGGNFYLQRTDLWSSWKHELSFDQLCQIPQQILAHELLLLIQQQGLNTEKPTDFVVPLVVFLQAIEHERVMLVYYQDLYTRMHTFKCAWLFPFNTKRYDQIEERLRRLSFVKNVFISWVATFNIEHAKSFSHAIPLS
jgi:uncharacterized protein YlbG (UPF0298 family)